MYKIVCVGKIKEDFITKGINEYTKRISAFTKLDIVEVKEVNTNNISNNMKEEANNILQKINKANVTITKPSICTNVNKSIVNLNKSAHCYICKNS